MLSTTSEFSYGMSVNMSATFSVTGYRAGTVATALLVIAPEMWKSTS